MAGPSSAGFREDGLRLGCCLILLPNVLSRACRAARAGCHPLRSFLRHGPVSFPIWWPLQHHRSIRMAASLFLSLSRRSLLVSPTSVLHPGKEWAASLGVDAVVAVRDSPVVLKMNGGSARAVVCETRRSALRHARTLVVPQSPSKSVSLGRELVNAGPCGGSDVMASSDVGSAAGHLSRPLSALLCGHTFIE